VIERLELLAKIGFQRTTVADVRAVGVFEVAKFGDQIKLDLTFGGCHYHDLGMRIGIF